MAGVRDLRTSEIGYRIMHDGAERLQDPFIGICISAFNEGRGVGGVLVQALRYVDRVVVCDDGSVDLTGAIAEGLMGGIADAACFYVQDP